MKSPLFLAGFLMSAATAGWAATSPLYINYGPLDAPPALPPQIDATSFENRSLFSISSSSFLSAGLPYETLNTLHFTNRSSGQLIGAPGFRFDFYTNNSRLMMADWINSGTIEVDTTLSVSASNLVSSGPFVSANANGVIKLSGKTVNLAHSALRTGADDLFATNSFFGGFFFGSCASAIGYSSNYVNASGITDLYWGTGTNNVQSGQGQTLNLQTVTNVFPKSPPHQVIRRSGNFFSTNLTTISPAFTGQFGFTNFSTNLNYQTHVFRSGLTATSTLVQVVYVPSPNFDTNLTTRVRFGSGNNGFGTPSVAVEFSGVDYDIALQQSITNSIYLIDELPALTNFFLARNSVASSYEPNNYFVSRVVPCAFASGNESNAFVTPTLFYNPGVSVSNTVPVQYSGYSAGVTYLNTSGGAVNTTPAPTLTNLLGRVEIESDQLDLSDTRIRAETAVILKTKNLVGNTFAQVDAPFLNYDLGSVQSALVISNIVPAVSFRLAGTLSAYSALWQNSETNLFTTNTTVYHVLIVQNNLQFAQPVTLNKLTLSGTNIVLSDALTLGGTLNIDTPNLWVQTNLTLPPGVSWGGTNFPTLINFTNDGQIFMSGVGNFGVDRVRPYDNFVNRGSIDASSLLVRTTNLFNSGLLSADTGSMELRAGQFTMVSTSSVPLTNLEAASDIFVYANDFTSSNSVIDATAGGLHLYITNRLTDAGPGATNRWSFHGDITALVKPLTGDLLGTEIKTTSRSFTELTWPGEDRGVFTNGYNNNLAVGKLTLDGASPGAIFHFSATNVVPATNAIYVDYLELLDYATNYNNAIAIDPNFTVYFADANVPPEKLNHTHNNRLRWVSTYAGPRSTTNVTYPSTITYPLNAAIVRSKDLDSDNDGTANSDDFSPVFVSENIALSITSSNYLTSTKVILNWNTIANSLNTVERADNPTTNWMVLTNFTFGPLNGSAMAMDSFPTNQMRFFRVRVDPPEP